MSIPPADDLRRNARPVTRAERERAEALRQAQERAEAEARIEQGHWTTRRERRQAEARAKEKAQAEYNRRLNERLPRVRSELESAIRSADGGRERSVRVEIGEPGGSLGKISRFNSPNGKHVIDNTAVVAGEILADEVRELGYTAQVMSHKEIENVADESYERTIIDIQISWLPRHRDSDSVPQRTAHPGRRGGHRREIYRAQTAIPLPVRTNLKFFFPNGHGASPK
jgi:hypothetical protein